MKKVYSLCLFMVLSFSILFFSCSRTVDIPETITSKDTSFENQYFTRNLDSTILTVTIKPALLCYSYGNGQPPMPCNFIVEMTCTLSKPIRAHVRVELQRIRVIEMADSTGLDAADAPESTVVINISPGQTRITFSGNKETYTSPANIREKYKLLMASVYQPMN